MKFSLSAESKTSPTGAPAAPRASSRVNRRASAALAAAAVSGRSLVAATGRHVAPAVLPAAFSP